MQITSNETSGQRFEVEKYKSSGVWAATFYNRSFGGSGSAMHQRRMFVPFGGQYIRTRLIWETNATFPSWNVHSHAVTSGRQLDETNPKNPDGSDAVWQSGGTIVTGGNEGGTTYSIVETYSPWYDVYVHPDATYPKWGTLVYRSRNAAASGGRARSVTNSNGRFNLTNGITQRYKDWMEYAANTTLVTSNNITLTSNTADPGADLRSFTSFQVEIETAQPSILICASGDSRTQGDGSTGHLWSWAGRAIEQMWMDGYTVGYEFHGLSGYSHSDFHAMAMDRLAKTGRKLPDIYIMQGASTNGQSWTDENIVAIMARNLEFASTCRSLGVIPVFITMYPSTGATNSGQVANWRKVNNALLASGVPVVDFYGRPEFTDGASIPILPQNTGLNNDAAHFNNTGHALAAQLLGIPAVKKLLI